MANAQVLVVEDANIIAKDIQGMLRRLGYAVPAVVSSGEKAIQKAAETHPDLVLMDIMLKGDMDGVEAAQQIRDRFHIPVIYLTAYADEDTLQRAKIAEPFGYILKPFDETELHVAIEMALYKHKAEEERERLIHELEDALAEIKTLRGILPICSSCKKIRDDEGYWNQLEAYIQEHSEAVFSHGLCPECAKKLYPEVFGDDR
jgi:CheY-like chemotaxis protein